MRPRVGRGVAAGLSAVCLLVQLVHAETPVETRLRLRIESADSMDSLAVVREPLFAGDALRLLYPSRAFAPFWVDERGLNRAGQALWQEIRQTERFGLRSEDYHGRVIGELLSDAGPGALVDLEFALTDAFLHLASDLAEGKLESESLLPRGGGDGEAENRYLELLSRAAVSADPAAALETLLPASPDYAALMQALARLRALAGAGGWKPLTPGPALRPGDQGPAVAALAERLRRSGDLDSEPAGRFDEALRQAVLRFQRRHGLLPDGVVGPDTRAALNVPVEQRIAQIEVNLERWRWLPASLGRRYVLVNIADFYLQVMEAQRQVMGMRVVVGRTYRSTPVFSGRITYLVFNPYWEVPRSIAVKDKLPLIKADPKYLAANHFTVLQGWGADERTIDPASVDWSRLSAANFPYRLRQDPGPDNPLGRVKFMFPNRYSVYLHDTPSRELFAAATRTFSSGCIRLERARDLADYLLAGNPRWDHAAVERQLAGGQEATVVLQSPLPVYLVYWTAWVDEAGVLNFRNDVYHRDAAVRAGLERAWP